MKPIFLLFIFLSLNQIINSAFLKNSEQKASLEMKNKKIPDMESSSKFEKVEIIKPDHIPSKTAEYVNLKEKNDMKSAILINTDKSSEFNSSGLTERPNFLSPVITSFSTRVSTPSHMYTNTESSPTYDLDSISK
jgi:hypothetical protein